MLCYMCVPVCISVKGYEGQRKATIPTHVLDKEQW